MKSNEKKLLLVIKYMPIFVISMFYFMFSAFLYTYNYELFKEYLKEFILLLIFFMIISLYFSFKISNYLRESLLEYKNEILKNMEENKAKDLILLQQSKLTTISELIYNISHQWRQPLSVITTIASGIKVKKELGANDDSKDIEMLDGILNSANYLSQTIENFRCFYIPNNLKTKFSITGCINKCIKITEIQFLNKNIIIKLDIEEFEIYGYEQQLIQVLLNILNNSRDAFVKNDLKQRMIFIKTKLLKDSISISIKDNAGGIEEKNLNKIFEPYYTTKHQSKGTGVSLYMSYQIISKSFGGNIFVENSEEEYLNKMHIGAKFRIIIPLNF